MATLLSLSRQRPRLARGTVTRGVWISLTAMSDLDWHIDNKLLPRFTDDAVWALGAEKVNLQDFLDMSTTGPIMLITLPPRLHTMAHDNGSSILTIFDHEVTRLFDSPSYVSVGWSGRSSKAARSVF